MIALDTNVLSELMRPVADSSVTCWFISIETQAWLPAIALCEVSYGIARLPNGRKRDALSESLSDWRTKLADRVLEFRSDTAMVFGEIFATAERAGQPMSFADAQTRRSLRSRASMGPLWPRGTSRIFRQLGCVWSILGWCKIGRVLIDSYHCSRYNQNTGRLTTEMFEAVFERACQL